MRIAVFVTSFPVPSETFILRQMTGMIDLGHEVKIYAAIRPPADEPVHSDVIKYRLPAKTLYLEDSIPPESGYWELPVWPLTQQTWPPGSDKSIPNMIRVLKAVPSLVHGMIHAPGLTMKALDSEEYGHEAQSLSTLYRLSALCSESQSPDVLHAHYGPVGSTFRFARRLWGKPLIVSFHGYDYSRYPKAEGSRVFEKLFQTADAITANSDYARARLEELGCPSSKLHKLQYGIRLEEFSYRPRTGHPGAPVRLVTVARLVEKKGIEFALRAFAKVRAKHAQVHYDIIGEGPLRERLAGLIAALGIVDAVRLHGAQNTDYVRQMMDAADLFVLPSVTAADGDQEGTPVSLMEAQATGLPVVSTRHAGIPEVVLDNESGFLVEERDIDGLSSKIDYLVEHPEVWATMGNRGRRYMQTDYDLGKLTGALAALYEDVKERSNG